MEPLGHKIAEGRDSEIYEHGSGKVIRLARDGRSLVTEAETMNYVRSRGYPCPEVHDAGDGYLVMDRVDGPTMMDTLGTPPFPLRRSGRVLADLHARLHEIPAPAGLAVGPLPGDRLTHGDLHPMNVLMTSEGPVVIDWANASAGDPSFDVADTWVVLACASPPVRGVDRLLVPLGRRLLLRAFLNHCDKGAAAQALRVAVAHRLNDPNTTSTEQENMRRLATRATTRWRSRWRP